jgi:predicted transcriptional regulator
MTTRHFDLLALLSPRWPADVFDLCEDLACDESAVHNSIRHLRNMGLGIIASKGKVKIDPDSWSKAKTLAIAHVERTGLE